MTVQGTTGDGRGDAATRVALLARNGEASERLQAALREAGADVVLVSDPADTDAPSVRAAGAQALLIALEPAVEEALDRFDTLLADPDVTVIFDEAELAAQRKGWDAARWTRHLAAKLNRHEQVLPPGADVDESTIAAALAGEPEPLAVYQRPESDGDISAFASEAGGRSDEVPRDFDKLIPSAASMFDPVLAEMDGPASEEFPGLPEFIEFQAPAASAQDEPGGMEPAPVAATLLGLPDIQLDAPEAFDQAPGAAADEPSGQQERFRRDLDALQLRIADMQLEDDRPARARAPEGAVLVMAGIGGPDAVRQLLGGLPAGFPRAVLVQQRLEGGRHDKLVRQMQRATSLPVSLVEPGMSMEPGHVYVLTADAALSRNDDGLHFSQAPGAEGNAILAGLPADDSAVVLLSGSDPALVDAVMHHAGRGALVAGQSPEGCFDALASEALTARGAEAGTPAQLAQRLAARWPAPAHAGTRN
ncbi:MAG: chemotaxis protein CheB [Luteimonas sp.]